MSYRPNFADPNYVPNTLFAPTLPALSGDCDGEDLTAEQGPFGAIPANLAESHR